jgi:hypothetical protein
MQDGLKPKKAIDRSISQHATILHENCEDVFDALILSEELEPDIEYRIKEYSRCISKNTDNFVKWLQDEYKRKLRQEIRERY